MEVADPQPDLCWTSGAPIPLGSLPLRLTFDPWTWGTKPGLPCPGFAFPAVCPVGTI
jgi:hypothetical protein